MNSLIDLKKLHRKELIIMCEAFYKKYNIELVEESEEKYTSVQLNDLKNKRILSTIIAKEVNNIFKLNKKAEEYMILLCLDTKNYINGIFEISHGGTNCTDCVISNILKRALLVNSDKIIVCHNHPSGNLKPSQYDYSCTKRLDEATKIIGIQLLDHIIIGRNDKYVSILNLKEGDRV